MRLHALASTLLLSFVVHSASADEPTAAVLLQHFETRIRPVLAHRCWSCHSERRGKSEGGLILDQVHGIRSGGDRGPLTNPDQPNQSLLLKAITGEDPDLQMPPAGNLQEQEIRDFEYWIQHGAPLPDNFAAALPDEPSDPAAGKTHWAFQPLLTSVELPASADEHSWAQTAIDRFILQRLQQNQLQPNADAAPETLLRRLSFALTGLPPTAQLQQRFLNSPDQQTFAAITDELLGSPAFGERWGRHWLDLARYADSNGLDENFLFREAWRYRNWVIDAVNRDLPFDQFLTLQLAGDLLPFETPEQRDQQRIATGFLVIGPKVLLGVGVDKQKMDVADEQISTIGRVVLAQTIGCARCHDHKFDPIPTADYYAMAGIFTSSQVMEQRYMLGQQRVMEQLVGLGEEGESLDDAYETYWRGRTSLVQRRDAAKQTLEVLKGGDSAAIAARLEQQPDSFAKSAEDPAESQDSRQAAQQQLVESLNTQIDNPPPIPPRAMVALDRDQPADEAIRIAGDHTQHGQQIPRGFLQVAQDSPASIPESTSGRLELAQWLTNKQTPAGILTARVQANRIWHHLFGQGIVRTVDNFGRTGDVPSHPELLDYLASRLLQHHWSVRKLIREIVTSRTFALSSGVNAAAESLDPDNRLLWKANRRRLDPESLRDAMLTAAGTLETDPVESTVSYLGDQATAVGANTNRRRTDFPCRTVYLPVIRNDLPEILDVFNFADPHLATGARPHTIVPSQALFMMNSPLVMQSAETIAERILQQAPDASAEKQLQAMYRLLHSSRISSTDLQTLADYLNQPSDHAVSQSRKQLLTEVCHALLCSTRFQYLD